MTKTEQNRLDKLAFESPDSKCKENAGFKCEICSKPKGTVQLHAHHVIGRRHRSLRWDLNNLVCLCAAHHKLSPRSAHENPYWFEDEMKKLRGVAWFENLRSKEQMICKADYETVLKYLNGELNNYC